MQAISLSRPPRLRSFAGTVKEMLAAHATVDSTALMVHILSLSDQASHESPELHSIQGKRREELFQDSDFVAELFQVARVLFEPLGDCGRETIAYLAQADQNMFRLNEFKGPRGRFRSSNLPGEQHSWGISRHGVLPLSSEKRRQGIFPHSGHLFSSGEH